MLRQKDLQKMINEGIPFDEIAEKFSGDYCADDFSLDSSDCYEDADCNNCWIKCLNKDFLEIPFSEDLF